MDYETILYTHEDHIVSITLNRPERRNCINQRMNLELQDAFKRFRDDRDALVAVITGAGGAAFCAGWDLDDAAAMTEMMDYHHYHLLYEL